MKCAICGTINENVLEDICPNCGNKMGYNPVLDKLNFNEKTKENVEEIEVPKEEVIEEVIEEKVQEEEQVEIVNVEVVNEANVSKEVVLKNESEISTKVNEFKGKYGKYFTKNNFTLGFIVFILIAFFIIFSHLLTSDNDKSNPKVVFESINTLFVNDPKEGKTQEITEISDDLDIELVKASNDNSVYYYPLNTKIENGVVKFDLYSTKPKKDEPLITNAYENYFVSEDGKNIVYLENVSNLYGEDVADIYLYNSNNNSEEILINTSVYINSIYISEDSKEMIYIKTEDNELFRYNFKNDKSKKIDSDVESIIDISDDLDRIFITKLQKKINEKTISTIFEIKGNKSKKLLDDVIKESINVNDESLVYLTAPDEYPDFSIFNSITDKLSKKEVKVLKDEFNIFCSENFYSLGEYNFMNKKEYTLANNVYKLNFISENGQAIVATSFKTIDEIDLEDVNDINDLISPKNLTSYFYDCDGKSFELKRVNEQNLLGGNEDFSYDYNTKNLYYIDSGKLIQLNYVKEIPESIEVNDGENVKKIWEADNSVFFLKTTGELLQIYKDGTPKQVDLDIIENSVITNYDNIYYQKGAKNSKIELYTILEDKKPDKISDELEEKEIYIADQYIYFFDKKDGLSYYYDKKVKKVDKNATEIKIIE